MQGDPKVIEYLNNGLRHELTGDALLISGRGCGYGI
jgi:hypothetical protein